MLSTVRNLKPHLAGLALLAVAAMGVSACSSGGTDADTGSGGASATRSGSAGTVDQALRAMLPSSVTDSNDLDVAISATFPPYGFKKDDSFTGISYELAQAVAGLWGVTFKYEDAKQALATTGLQSGKYELAITVFVDSPVAEKNLTFIDWIKRNSTLLVPQGNPKHVQSLDDFCNGSLKIAIVNSSSQAPFIEKQSAACKDKGKSAINVAYFDNSNAGVLALSSGRADAMLLDTLSGRYSAKATGNLEQTGPSYIAGYYGWGVNAPNQELAKAAQAALQKLLENGEYAKILAKYDAASAALPSVQINAAAKGGSSGS